MAPFTVIETDARSVDAEVVGDRVVLPVDALPAALGWKLQPEGLCRDDVCVPVRDRSELLVDDDIDLAAVTHALGRVSVVDTDARIAAVALPAEVRHRALDSLEAAPFALAGLDGTVHELAEWRGTKKLLVAFASW